MNLLHTIVAFVGRARHPDRRARVWPLPRARICNVKVLRFSVGFGKPLLVWRRGRDATEWILAAIPFGGT
jgi:hypothetical protein